MLDCEEDMLDNDVQWLNQQVAEGAPHHGSVRAQVSVQLFWWVNNCITWTLNLHLP